MSAPPGTSAARPDGRDSRWAQHRTTRRRELVDAAIKAIRKHGATIGMDEIAAEAHTSKTVIYRHLGDRLGLYLAVCEAVDELIVKDVGQALDASVDRDAVLEMGRDPRPALVAVIDSYLRLVEHDPELYRFVTRRPLLDVPPDRDPVTGLADAIASTLAGLFEGPLAASGRDPAAALTWSHGLVGFVRESADRWLVDPNRQPREAVAQQLADFAAFGLSGVLAGPRPSGSTEFTQTSGD
ncbi:TetR/AcrR family transcriptional regulator [Luteipulveratus sp. YIM 133132]|uniref:TetR/AcrR family transcriptional regulator n=1 Tax=Luteipulveratus flavus TaxID=3031728 RepID=UPI0023AFFEF1|nr:TetR/AcrR family transcriptional regulator [Luteipulveratus sp. YIM 133132]MDE9365166.1 TetR/AcrR family transcriptional regulator [Luteipulveratus sp. YIM 133132]